MSLMRLVKPIGDTVGGAAGRAAGLPMAWATVV